MRINDNGPLTISYTSGSNATVAGTFTTPIRAIHPAGISSSDTVTLPAEYQYATTGGLQKLESPMATYSASGNEVHFKHLTGALTVAVTNTTGATMVIDAITVTSSKYQLSGEWNVDFTALEGTGTPVETATAADRRWSCRDFLPFVALYPLLSPSFVPPRTKHSRTIHGAYTEHSRSWYGACAVYQWLTNRGVTG